MGGDVVVEDESSSPCSCCFSVFFLPKFSDHEADLRRRVKSYQKILQSQDRVRNSKRKLKLARLQILSYTPGSWSHVDLSDYHVPKMTSIIVVGPKGAGKNGSHSKGGTFFVEEYMIPRGGGSASFCLYDTRGLNQNSPSDNTRMIEQWITRGARHGKPVIWNSDSSELRDRLIRDSGTGCRQIRKVNSVIFVVNAAEVLKSMESETSYAHMISTAFNCPILSFKDDKPAVVMTHGDILSREERAQVRVYLGELLSIPPEKQIFDIPERRVAATVLTICDLLRYSLEHADKNLPFLPKKNFTISKVVAGLKRRRVMLKLMIFLALPLLLALALNCIRIHGRGQNVAHEAQHKRPIFRPPSRLYNLTRKDQPKPNRRRARRHTRTLLSVGPNHGHVPNLEPESVLEGEPSIDSHIARRLWYDEGKVAEAEPSFDWRTTRRLWYVE